MRKSELVAECARLNLDTTGTVVILRSRLKGTKRLQMPYSEWTLFYRGIQSTIGKFTNRDIVIYYVNYNSKKYENNTFVCRYALLSICEVLLQHRHFLDELEVQRLANCAISQFRRDGVEKKEYPKKIMALSDKENEKKAVARRTLVANTEHHIAGTSRLTRRE